MRKLVLSSIILMAVSTMNAATVFSENFEGSTIGFYATPSTITGSIFQLIGNTGSADINGPDNGVGPVDYGWLCASPAASGKCLDTTGSGSRGTIETILSYNFTPGTYQLSIGITRWNDTVAGGGLQDANLRINIGSLFSNSYAVNSSWINGIVVETFTVATGTTAKLTIADASGTAGFAGAIIDNISVDSVNGIPEPSTYALIGSGVAALFFARRKR